MPRARARQRLDNWSWTQASSIAQTHDTLIQTKCLPESPGLEPLALGHKSSALVGTAVDLALSPSLYSVGLSDHATYWILRLFGPCPKLVTVSDEACIDFARFGV